jgi:hypothetical protein
MSEDPILQVVCDGEAAQAVTAYLAAVHGAAMLQSALAGVGLADAVLFIIPSVSDAKESVGLPRIISADETTSLGHDQVRHSILTCNRRGGKAYISLLRKSCAMLRNV